MDKKRWTTLLLLLLLMSLPALAQGGGSREITGIVVDELGEPLIGATVTNVRNRGDRETFTAITDVNGHFKLTLSRDVQQVEVSYIGFQPQVVGLTSSNS